MDNKRCALPQGLADWCWACGQPSYRFASGLRFYRGFSVCQRASCSELADRWEEENGRAGWTDEKYLFEGKKYGAPPPNAGRVFDIVPAVPLYILKKEFYEYGDKFIIRERKKED